MDLFEHFARVEEELPEDYPGKLITQSYHAAALWRIGQKVIAKQLLAHVVSIARRSMPNHPNTKAQEEDLRMMEKECPVV